MPFALGLKHTLAANVSQRYSVQTLRILITIWVVAVLVAAWTILDNPWALGLLFAYEVLP